MKQIFISLTNKNISKYDLTINDNQTYSDEYCVKKGFSNLTKTVKNPSAWDKAFLYIKENKLIDSYDYFWFIEDDVYIPNIEYLNVFKNHKIDLLTNLLERILQDKQHNWRRWNTIQNDISYFEKDQTGRTFNPLCRLSSKLIKSVLDFQEQHNTFVFHEILFPSLVIQNKLSMRCFRAFPFYKKFFGYFEYRPTLSKNIMRQTVINHPIKDLYEHTNTDS